MPGHLMSKRNNPVKSEQPIASQHSNSQPAQKTTCSPPWLADWMAPTTTGERRQKARTQITPIKSATKQDLALSCLRHDTQLIKGEGA